jgi:hypothetical protein
MSAAPFTSIPNRLLDHYLADLTGGETKVLLYLARRTYGFQRDIDQVSISQICSGIRKRDGAVLDRGTGLARETAVAALVGLQKKGLVVRTLGSGTVADSYTLVNLERSENPTAIGQEIRPVISRKIRPLSVGKSDSQKKGKSSSKRKRKKVLGVDCASEGEPHRENPKPPKPNPSILKPDDDEKPARAPLSDPVEEFRARLIERHAGIVDANQVLSDVLAELDCLPMAEFLVADSKATTAPARLTNPHGHYRKLARKLAHRARTHDLMETLERSAAFLRPPTTPPVRRLCGKCDDGLMADGSYCDCGVGAVRRQVDEYAATQRQQPKDGARPKTEAA